MSDAPRRAAAFTATNVAAETGADELPLIAVSAGNFNTASAKGYVSPVASLVLHDTKCLVFCVMLIHGGLHSETSDISALWSISPMKCPAESNGAGRRRNPLAASSSDGGVKPAGRNPGDSPADILKCKTL